MRIPDYVVRNFFEYRFKRTPESDPSYFHDWERRFSYGDEEAMKFMDDKTLRAYRKVRNCYFNGGRVNPKNGRCVR